MELALAIAGILLGIAFFLIQKRWRERDRRSRVRVSISEPADRYGSVAFLVVANDSPWPVQAMTAGFDLPDMPDQPGGDSMCWQMLRDDGGTFSPVGATYPPQTIPPKAAWRTMIHRDIFESLLGRPPVVTAFVTTATGELFQSAPTELWGDAWKQQLAELEEAENRRFEGSGSRRKATDS